jgi:SmpA / OmlA family
MLLIGGVVVVVLLVVVVVRAVSNRGSGPAEPPSASPTGNRLTLENFRRLRFGMSYDQVVDIMGPPQFNDISNYANGSKSRNVGWSNGRDTVSVQFFDDANKANVVCATFDRVTYNAPKP